MQNHSPVLLGEKEVTSRSSTSRETLRGWEWINSWKREMIRRKETQAHISYIRHTRYTWHKQERQSDTIREEEKKNPNKEEKDNADKEQLNEKKRRTHDPATGFLSLELRVWLSVLIFGQSTFPFSWTSKWEEGKRREASLPFCESDKADTCCGSVCFLFKRKNWDSRFILHVFKSHVYDKE